MKLLYISMYMGILCLMACNKSGDAAAGHLKKAWDENTERYNDYSYDGRGRLIQATTSGMYGSAEVEYHYTDHRISELLITTRYPVQTGISVVKHRKIFTYSNDGRLSEIKMDYDGGPVPTGNIIRYEFVYVDGTDRFSTCRIYQENAGTEIFKWRIDFQYDARGNISHYRNYFLNNNQWEGHEGKSFKYAVVKNPYYRTGDPTDFGNYYSRDFWTEMITFGFPGSEPVRADRSYKTLFPNVVVYSNVERGVATHYEYY